MKKQLFFVILLLATITSFSNPPSWWTGTTPPPKADQNPAPSVTPKAEKPAAPPKKVAPKPGQNVFGMGIIYEGSRGQNHGNKNQVFAFAKHETPFPLDSTAVYTNHITKKPISMNYYRSLVPMMSKVHNQSMCAQLTYINAMTGGQLAKDFGFSFSDFTGRLDDALEVFMSDEVFYDKSPEGQVIYDGVDVNYKCVHTVLRDAYFNKSDNLTEHGWWLNVTGYEPIYIKSAWCNNNTSTKWLKNHIVKKEIEQPVVKVEKPKQEIRRRYYDEEIVITNTKVFNNIVTTATATSTNSGSTVTVRNASATTTNNGHVRTDGSGNANAVAISGINNSHNGTGAGIQNGSSTTTGSDGDDWGAAGNVQK